MWSYYLYYCSLSDGFSKIHVPRRVEFTVLTFEDSHFIKKFEWEFLANENQNET